MPKKPVIQFVSYAFRIVEWAPAYHLTPCPRPKDVDLWWESASIELEVEAVAPKKLTGRKLNIDLRAERRLAVDIATPPETEWRPKSVGYLEVRGDYSLCGVSLPYDAFWGVSGWLRAGKVGCLVFNGEPLRRGKASLRSLTLRRGLSEDDLWEAD